MNGTQCKNEPHKRHRVKGLIEWEFVNAATQ